MNCRSICDHLSAYLDAELEAELAGQVKLHLASCGKCREELDSLRELTGILHALPRERAPEEIEREVVSYIEEDLLLRKPRRSRWAVVARKTLAGLGVAAAVFLVGVSVYIYFAPHEPTPPDMMLASKAASDVRRGATEWKGATDAPGVTYGMPEKRDDLTRTEQSAPTTLAFRNGMVTLDRKNGRGRKGLVAGVEVLDPEQVVAKARGGSRIPEGPPTIAAGDVAQRGVRRMDSKPAAVPDTTTSPMFAAPTLEVGAVAQAEVAAKKKPAELEFLDLELEDDDFAAARRHIIAVATSLDIPSVDLGVQGTEALRRLILGAYFGEAERYTGRPRRALEEDSILGDRYYEAKAAGKDLPAVVLVVEEDKLPRLVARLAVPRPRDVAGVLTGPEELGRPKAVVAKAKTMTRRPVRGTRHAGEVKEAEKDGDEGEPRKDVTAQVLDQLRRMEQERRTRTRTVDVRKRLEAEAPGPRVAAKPSRVEEERKEGHAREVNGKAVARTPGRADLKRELLEDALKTKAKKAKLVYLRIYLKRPRVRSAPAARTAPAPK